MRHGQSEYHLEPSVKDGTQLLSKIVGAKVCGRRWCRGGGGDRVEETTDRRKQERTGVGTRVLLIFVDGLGVGERDPAVNPIACFEGGLLGLFRDGRRAREGIGLGLDATLGVSGLPQSATGQTTLLTGVNGAAELGYHLFGFPNRRLREIIMEHSLLRNAVGLGRRAAFLNAFRPRFFEIGAEIWKRPLSVTTWANGAAGLPFFTLDDVAARRSIYQDFTNGDLRAKGFDVPLFSPEEAGRILAARSADFDFLLYEFFKTDMAGHSRDMERCVEVIGRLERFLEAALAAIDLDETLVILTSDHGNIEDLSVRTHTLNPAMTLLWGKGAAGAGRRLRSIGDVAGLVLGIIRS
jgi:2,3-bisphosphoglycerate-independent phosphoglycerate mutase